MTRPCNRADALDALRALDPEEAKELGWAYSEASEFGMSEGEHANHLNRIQRRVAELSARPTYRVDVQSLADMYDETISSALRHVERWMNANPADTTIHAMWTTLRNEHDHREFYPGL